jgi:hypothetical protein
MIVNQRFFINEDRYIIDRINWANNGLLDVPVGALEDEHHLRAYLLETRIKGLFRDLIAPTRGKKKNRDYEYKPFNQAEHALSSVLVAIGASRLSGLEYELNHQKFDGKLKRDRRGMQDYTSLALFVDDVERLLRDLYGDFDDQATDRIRSAVFDIMGKCTKWSPKDLWREYADAKTIDYGWYSIGVIPGDGINTNEVRDANNAAADIILRARTVRANPTSFSKYTIQFVKALDEHWPKLDNEKRSWEKWQRRALALIHSKK